MTLGIVREQANISTIKKSITLMLSQEIDYEILISEFILLRILNLIKILI